MVLTVQNELTVWFTAVFRDTFFFFLILLWNEVPCVSKPNKNGQIQLYSYGESLWVQLFRISTLFPLSCMTCIVKTTLVITSVCTQLTENQWILGKIVKMVKFTLSAKPSSHSPAFCCSPSVSPSLCTVATDSLLLPAPFLAVHTGSAVISLSVPSAFPFLKI